MKLTDKEQDALDKSVALWNALVELPIIHEDDIPELRVLIHNIQARIMSRPFRRERGTQYRCRKCGQDCHYKESLCLSCVTVVTIMKEMTAEDFFCRNRMPDGSTGCTGQCIDCNIKQNTKP